MTHGRDSPKVGWVTNRGQLGWKLGVQQVSQYITVDCVYYTGATNLHDVIALVHPSCACPPRVAPVICVMAPPIHLGAWSMTLMLWLPFELLLYVRCIGFQTLCIIILYALLS